MLSSSLGTAAEQLVTDDSLDFGGSHMGLVSGKHVSVTEQGVPALFPKGWTSPIPRLNPSAGNSFQKKAAL